MLAGREALTDLVEAEWVALGAVVAVAFALGDMPPVCVMLVGRLGEALAGSPFAVGDDDFTTAVPDDE